MTLHELQVGQKVELNGFCETLPRNYQIRLEELGFIPGRSIRCTQRSSFGGPKLFLVGTAVYSLDGETAKKILVSSSS